MGRYGAECLFTSGLLVSAWFGGARQRGANESNFWPARKIPFRINWPEHGAHYRGKDAQQYHLTVLCTYDLGKFCTCKCSSQVNEDCFCHVESHLCCHWLCSLTQMWLFWNVIFFYAFCLFKFYCCQGRKTLQQQSHLTKTLNGKSFVKIILQKLITMYTHECDESSCLATVKPWLTSNNNIKKYLSQNTS